MEITALAERINEQCKRDDDVIDDHLDALIELLQGYKVRRKLSHSVPIVRFRTCANDWKTPFKRSRKPFRRPAISRDAR